MELFYIQGKSNSEKSGAIKHTINSFLKLDKSKVLYVSVFRREDKGMGCDKNDLINHINTSIESGLMRDRNIGLVLIEINGKIIGVTTYGDALKGEVIENFEVALKESKERTGKELDAFVCARHDKKNIEVEFAEFVHQVGKITVNTPIPSVKIMGGDTVDFDKDNRRKGEKLFKMIMEQLNI